MVDVELTVGIFLNFSKVFNALDMKSYLIHFSIMACVMLLLIDSKVFCAVADNMCFSMVNPLP